MHVSNHAFSFHYSESRANQAFNCLDITVLETVHATRTQIKHHGRLAPYKQINRSRLHTHTHTQLRLRELETCKLMNQDTTDGKIHRSVNRRADDGSKNNILLLQYTTN